MLIDNRLPAKKVESVGFKDPYFLDKKIITDHTSNTFNIN